MRLSCCTMASLLLVCTAPHSLQAAWTFSGLGTLGGDTSRAFGVSGDGSVVVGYSRDADSHSPAFRWEGGTMVALEGFAAPAASDVAYATSADGSVIVGNAPFGPLSDLPCRWEDGQIEALDSAPPLPYYIRGSAYAVSADGSIAVGYSKFREWGDDQGPSRATRWIPQEGGGYLGYALGTLGGEHASAYGVSADGSVVVGSSGNAAHHTEAFRWEGHMVGLGTFGGDESRANGVSADGSIVVGYAYDTNDGKRAFRWEDGLMVDLGTLGGPVSAAEAISADGSLIVGSAAVNDDDYEPFLWSEADGMRSLSQMLTDHGVDLTGWQSLYPTGISADGRVIVGNAYNPDGHRRGWIATIPEPSTLILLLTLAATTAFCAVMRRKRTTAQKL